MIRFFVLAYGAEFSDLYLRSALFSLTQPNNKIPNAIVSVHSDIASMSAVAGPSEQLGEVEPHFITPQDDPNDTQRDAFIEEIKRCVEQSATMVVVSPDNYWGNGSLPNSLAILGEQDVCLGIPHMRVDKDKFLSECPTHYGINNEELVSLSMKTIHPSWANCDPSDEKTNTFFTGISMSRITKDLYAVTHLLPTCFVCRFNASDYGYFAERRHVKGLFDHHWPEKLAREGRLRVVGSSDAAFIAELTPAGTHNAQTTPSNPKNESEFHRTAPHIEANRTLVSIWRASI